MADDNRPKKSGNGVGRGKPPKEHQFKKGGKGGPGRPKGSRNRPSHYRMLDERVKVGEDRLGRPIYKTWREVNHQQLMKMIAGGNFQAMRFVAEMDFKLAELDRRYGEKPLTASEALAQAEEEAERK